MLTQRVDFNSERFSPIESASANVRSPKVSLTSPREKGSNPLESRVLINRNANRLAHIVQVSKQALSTLSSKICSSFQFMREHIVKPICTQLTKIIPTSSKVAARMGSQTNRSRASDTHAAQYSSNSSTSAPNLFSHHAQFNRQFFGKDLNTQQSNKAGKTGHLNPQNWTNHNTTSNTPNKTTTNLDSHKNDQITNKAINRGIQSCQASTTYPAVSIQFGQKIATDLQVIRSLLQIKGSPFESSPMSDKKIGATALLVCKGNANVEALIGEILDQTITIHTSKLPAPIKQFILSAALDLCKKLSSHADKTTIENDINFKRVINQAAALKTKSITYAKILSLSNPNLAHSVYEFRLFLNQFKRSSTLHLKQNGDQFANLMIKHLVGIADSQAVKNELKQINRAISESPLLNFQQKYYLKQLTASIEKGLKSSLSQAQVIRMHPNIHHPRFHANPKHAPHLRQPRGALHTNRPVKQQPFNDVVDHGITAKPQPKPTYHAYTTSRGEKIAADPHSPELQPIFHFCHQIIKAQTGISPNPQKPLNSIEREQVIKVWINTLATFYEDKNLDDYGKQRDQMLEAGLGLDAILKGKAAVCRELSIVASLLFSQYGIDSHVASGNMSGGGRHVWVELLDSEGQVTDIIDSNYERGHFTYDATLQSKLPKSLGDTIKGDLNTYLQRLKITPTAYLNRQQQPLVDSGHSPILKASSKTNS